MKSTNKVRINNELISIFQTLPKSTNTAMSWLLLHKAMEVSLKSEENLMKFNLFDFIIDYNIEHKRTDNIKRDLIRDFKKLKNQVEIEKRNELGQIESETHYFFQRTKINHETLDVEVILNEKIYNSVSSIPNKNYFQFLKQEAILIANKKLNTNDVKILLFLKSKSHNAKESYVKIKIEKLYELLGQSSGTRFADIKKRHIDPFIERCLDNTNYVISYEIQKNKLNKRKIESILFRVDNRKERISIVSKQLDSTNSEINEIGSKAVTELADKNIAPQIIKHENEVKSQILEKKLRQEKIKIKSKQKEKVVEEQTEAFDLFKFE